MGHLLCGGVDSNAVNATSHATHFTHCSLVTDSPGFSERSGHGVVVDSEGRILVIAGWPHLHDMWVSEDEGKTFTKESNSVFNCNEDKCGKFDFWPMLSEDGTKLFTVGGSGAYSTFGTLFDDVWVSVNDVITVGSGEEMVCWEHGYENGGLVWIKTGSSCSKSVECVNMCDCDARCSATQPQ